MILQLPVPTPPDEVMQLWFEVEHGQVGVRARDWAGHDYWHVTDEHGTLSYTVPPGATRSQM